MLTLKQQNQALREELAEVQAQFRVTEGMMHAVRTGEADAVVFDTPAGKRLFVLQGAEQPYREMVETMSEGAVTVTPGGVILYCNKRFAEMVKANLETVIGSNLLAYCSGENIAQVSVAFQESRSSVPRMRATLLALDATLVPVNIAMRSQNGHGSDSVAIVITDLTGWQHAEQARERAIRALRITNVCADVIIHASDEAAILTGACKIISALDSYRSVWIGPSDDGTAASFCPYVRSAGSYGAEESIDFGPSESTPGSEPVLRKICPRSAFDLCDGQIGPTLGKPACAPHGIDDSLSVTVPLVAGDEFFGCWVFHAADPSVLDQEELRLLATLANDLAFGIAAQRDKRARSRLAAIVESACDAIVGRDLDGKITSWNNAAERLLQYRAEEVIGRPTGILCPPELAGETDRLFEKILQGETIADYDTVRLSKNGRRIPVSLTYSSVLDDAGCIVGAAVFLHDSTMRKASEEALRLEKAQSDLLTQSLANALDQAEQASQAKSRFLATVTHDLRTPLHGILGYAEMLTLEGGLNATQLERLEAMAAAGHGLLDTINAVLDMSQIEANQLALWPVEIELPDFLRSCLDVIRPVAEAKGLALAPAPAVPLRIVADPGRFRQVVINLLGNAVKFTPAGSVEVRLRQADAEDFVRLEVADTGPGVWARHRDKLFNAFERLNAEAMSGIEGSGLGLAIAARLVRLMGGRIGYDDNPGGGSVFWVELPIGAVSSVNVEVVAPMPLVGMRHLRVLVVDDDALNRNIASGFLSIAGHDVVCLDNGAAAVQAAARSDFDVILMDVRMPGMNGLEATRLIRALPGARGAVRVVAVTAQAFAEQIAICQQAGMDGHVSKPFKQAVLLAALENVATAPGDTETAARLPSAAGIVASPELPVLDGAAFEDIAESLSPDELGENLQILVTRCEALLRGLCESGPRSPASELAEIAHKLAGGGGTFGFSYVAAAARQFERAVESGAGDAPVLATRLSAAIEASLPILRECIGASSRPQQHLPEAVAATGHASHSANTGG